MNKYLLNNLEVEDICIDGIDTADYPDFTDAYISDASILENGKWRDATDVELEQLSEDYDLVNQLAHENVF